MAIKQYVPSPEEIAQRLAAFEAGRELPEIGKIPTLEHQVKTLERQVAKKRTAAELRQALDLLMEKYDFSAAEQLIKMVMELKTPDDPDSGFKLDEGMRVRILTTLIEYEVPKLKSVEVTGHVEHQHEVVIVRYGDDGGMRRETLTQQNAPSPARLPETAGKIFDSAIDVEVLKS